MLKIKDEIYDIGGMHCAACSSSVERVTKKLNGVKTSEVNLPMNRLSISYDENLCKPQDIINKIEKAGFTAKLHSDEISPNDVNIDKKSNSLKNKKISLIISSCLAALLLIISMGQMLSDDFPVPDIISIHTHPFNFALIQLLLCIPVLFLGKRFFTGGLKSLFHGNPNMDTLVAVSATASFIYSLVMTFLISDNHHAIHNLYYESAAVVVALVSVGKYLEDSNKEKTKDAITKLMNLSPDTALLIDNNGQWEVPVSIIKVGDTVLVKSGTKIPLDGVVIEGSGSINESMLTGESLPVKKEAGDEVIGGSISVDGALYVKITKIGQDTMLSKIIQFIENAQGKKAPVARAADKVAGVFVPVVMIISVICAIIWLISGAEFSFALKIFTCILVIACPCSMGLATPTAIIVGTGIGAQHGILIRNGESLETAHKVNVAIFDKTGTITNGKPVITDIIANNEIEIIKKIIPLEKLSDHPLSKAVCDYAKKMNICESVLSKISDFTNLSGYGITGKDQNSNTIIIGNLNLMKKNNIKINNNIQSKINEFSSKGKTVIMVAENNNFLGLICISDTIKSDATKCISDLKKIGIKTILLTGDNKATANSIGNQIGVDEIYSQVLPTDKADIVKIYQNAGKCVMMVGDGINDAPALTQADIGCAVGSGSDIAIDSADIILIKSNLTDVFKAIKLSRMTIKNIHQNLFWAFCYNVIGIPIAAGILYPAFHILLSPMIGGLAMSLSSLFVVGNALRLKTKKL